MYIPDELLRKLMASKSKPLELFERLYLEADEQGVVMASRSKLVALTGMSEQTVRTSMKILVTNQVTNQELTKITILNIDSYRACSPATNQVSNQVKDKETEKDRKSPLSPTTPNSTKEEKDKEKENLHTKGARKIFVPPTIDEVRSYIQEKGYNVDADQWWNFYNAKNWMIGKNKMVKWKSAVATWNKQPQTTAAHRTEEIGQIYRQSQTKYTEGW